MDFLSKRLVETNLLIFFQLNNWSVELDKKLGDAVRYLCAQHSGESLPPSSLRELVAAWRQNPQKYSVKNIICFPPLNNLFFRQM
jgi:hypothetical protein